MAKKQYLSVRPYTPRNLPDGYTQALYIESTGTQCMDTGFTPNQDTSVHVDVAVMNTGKETTGGYICGSCTVYQQAGIEIYAYDGVFRTVSRGVDVPGTVTAAAGERVSVRYDKNVINISRGTTVYLNHTFATTAFTSATTLRLFGMPRSPGFWGLVKVYACQIYDNGTLVRDYVPCVIDATGEYGLYDFVTQKFYGNKGTGAFSGLRLAKLPDGYTQVEYIESSGTQYVDSGVIPTSENLKVDLDFKFTADFSKSTLFGSKGSTFSLATYNNPMAFYVGSSRNILPQSVALNTKYSMSAHANNGTLSVVLNGVSSSGAYSGSMDKTTNLYLFAYNTDGVVSQFASAKFYVCQIYDNGTLARDYIPCITAAGVAGLYDLVTNSFYGNAGTGAFAYGEIIGAAFREVKKRYLTTGNTHHKVKKGYLTIGGVFKRFLGGDGVWAYYGTASSLVTSNFRCAAVPFADYAIFAGGRAGASGVKYINYYNRSLTRTYAEGMQGVTAGGVNSNYAVFSGYCASHSSGVKTVHTCNRSLTVGTATAMSQSASDVAAGSVGDYAVLYGLYWHDGEYSHNYTLAYAYNSSLTQTPLTLSAQGGNQVKFAPNVGNYMAATITTSVTNYFDASLTRRDGGGISLYGSYVACLTVGDKKYAVYLYGTSMQYINESLTISSATIPDVHYEPAATSLNGLGIVAGGRQKSTSNSSNYKTAYSINESLTFTALGDMSQARCAARATTVGNYALIAGGKVGASDSNDHVSTVNAYVYTEV